MALLVLGLAQRDQHEAAATHTLRTFLHDYPGHPAARQVRRLLAEHS
jgi:TolA-binding protein